MYLQVNAQLIAKNSTFSNRVITASFSYDNLCAKVTELPCDGVAVPVHDVASQFQQAHESLALVRSIRLNTYLSIRQ